VEFDVLRLRRRERRALLSLTQRLRRRERRALWSLTCCGFAARCEQALWEYLTRYVPASPPDVRQGYALPEP